MDTLRLVDVGVFFTFFLLLFVWPHFFFFFGGALRFFFAELPHCVNHSVRTETFLDLVRGFFCFFFNLLWEPRYLFTAKNVLFYPHYPSFSAVQVWGGGWSEGHTLVLVVCCWFGVCGLEMPVEGLRHKH